MAESGEDLVIQHIFGEYHFSQVSSLSQGSDCEWLIWEVIQGNVGKEVGEVRKEEKAVNKERIFKQFSAKGPEA